MAQIDLINYTGQLVTTVVAFTVLLWFIGTVVRPHTHTTMGLWANIPSVTARTGNEYRSAVNTRATEFANTFGSLASRTVDTLNAFTLKAMKALSLNSTVSSWKSGILSYISRYNRLPIRLANLSTSAVSSKAVKKGKNKKVVKGKATLATKPVKAALLKMFPQR